MATARAMFSERTPARTWDDDAPELRAGYREVAARNLDSLRAAASHFALASHVSNHRQLSLEIQRFYELRMKIMLKSLSRMVETLEKGEIEEYDKKSGENITRPITLDDMRDYQKAQVEMGAEMKDMLSLAGGKINMQDLLFPPEGMGAPAPIGAPMPSFGVSIQNQWTPSPASQPIEMKDVDLSRVEICGEVIGSK